MNILERTSLCLCILAAGIGLGFAIKNMSSEVVALVVALIAALCGTALGIIGIRRKHGKDSNNR